MSNRIEWIDATRGVAIVLVVFGHKFNTQLSDTLLLTGFLRAIRLPALFFLSGLTHSSQTVPFTIYFKKVLNGLVMPYFLLSIISYVIWLLTYDSNCTVKSCVGWFQPIIGIFYGISGYTNWLIHNPPIWFITCLVSVKILFSLIIRCESIRSRLICVILLSFASHIWLKYGFRLPWNFDIAGAALVFYYFGFAAKNLSFFKKNRGKKT